MFRYCLNFIALIAINYPCFSQDSSSYLKHWTIKPQADVGADSLKLFDDNYSTDAWVKANVPSTAFVSYVEAGLEKDPNFGDNIYKVDKSKYDRNFWYRTTFNTKQLATGGLLWLNFEGINRKADIYLNGVFLGHLDGFMERGKYNITNIVNSNKPNILAVLVYYPHRPIPNYASPTYISSDGWDWMPSVPGLEMGITDDVYLSESKAVTLVDPWVRSKLPTLDEADISIQTQIHNNSDSAQKGKLVAVINPGNIVVEHDVHIGANRTDSVNFFSNHYKQLILQNPKLWWPNGYGDANLYTCKLSFVSGGDTSDSKLVTFGIRKIAYDTLGSVLHIWVNNKRIFIRGGNWGMSEYLLRCRGDEYATKLRLHKDMNMNMIRNWIGSTTDEEFYNECDKYGMLVWDDFWLNSHPNLPDDLFAFNKNAVEKIKRLRNHVSIAVWCGDNEGYPIQPINGWLKEDVKAFDGDDRLYQPNSHSDALTGSGPWANSDPSWYFTKYPSGFGGNKGWGFRTEIGTAVFTSFESFKKFMPKEDWWPRNEMWNLHFFGPSASNGGPDRYDLAINQNFGKATGIEDYCKKAQLLNIQTNQALYEGWQHAMWNDASGVMTWMSQSAYPSLVWQTYDYYYDCNGAYWGVKKACEPLHIQISAADNSVKVINTTLKNYNNLTAEANVYNNDGSLVGNLSNKVSVNVMSDTTADCFTLNLAKDNLAFKKKAVSSSDADLTNAGMMTDGSMGSRWSSSYSDSNWVYVDLDAPQTISRVVITWESAHAKAFKLQLSDDANTWKDVYATDSSDGGVSNIVFPAQKARYVRMLGLQRATQWGYSIFEFEVYNKVKTALSDVYFIKLLLKDTDGKILSDNFYWRSSVSSDLTGLNTMNKATLKTTIKSKVAGGKFMMDVAVTNTSSKAIALANHVQVLNSKTGERILPAFISENYFALLKNETKNITIEFDAKLLNGANPKLVIEPYNN